MFRIKKVSSLAFLISFFISGLYPLSAAALMQIPDIEGTITIVKYTIGGDGVFNFQIDEEQDLQSDQRFDVQVSTSNLVGSQDLVLPGGGSTYYIKEDPAAGWDFSDVYCGSLTHESFTYVIGDIAVVQLATGDQVHCIFTNKKIIDYKDPALIIPGIMGSFQKDGEWVIDPVMHSYENLIETLEINGYQEGVDLFRFPYDWRQSNTITALYLENKIDEIKQICVCDKVDIVAHSMGGLVARQYIQSDRYNRDVDQLIFLSTPHLGSAKAYLAWEAGETGPTILKDTFYQWYVSRQAKKNGFDSVFDYVRNFPILSAKELLPTNNYLIEDSTLNQRIYPYFYPRNEFLEELNNNVQKLYDSGVKITNIVGVLPGDTTLEYYKVIDSEYLPMWEHGYPKNFYSWVGDRGMIKGVGDETVPLNSAAYISSDLVTINDNHNRMLTSAEGVVFKKLTNTYAAALINKQRGTDRKFIIFDMLSPADMMVIDPEGKRIGRDFGTGEEINEIEYAFYSGFETDNEFITIPDPLDGKYQIITKGTGQGGEFTVATSFFTGEKVFEADFTSFAEPEIIKELALNLDNTKPEETQITPVGPITPASTIADIEQAYKLGWIYKEKTKNQLIKKLEKIIKKQDKIEYLEDSNKKNKEKKIIKIEKTIDKILGKTLLKELERDYYKKGVINKWAYSLIKSDIEWMLSN